MSIETRIFLTIEIIGLVGILLSAIMDVNYRYGYEIDDGGWRISYLIKKNSRRITANIFYSSVITIFIGFIYLIWAI